MTQSHIEEALAELRRGRYGPTGRALAAYVDELREATWSRAKLTLHELEEQHIRQALEDCRGNKTHAAKRLGIDRRTLYRRLETIEPKKNEEEQSMSTLAGLKVYKISVNWDDEDGCFIGRVAEFPSLAAHGETPESALQEIQSALDEAIADLRKNKKHVPLPTGRIK